MAVYTTQLRSICESLSGQMPGGYTDTSKIIETARPQIFDFSYPIFEDSYKSVLETKIIRHYYTQEIGLETYGLFKFKLETRLNEIMPYYNKLYESNELKYDVLTDYSYRKTHQGSGTSDATEDASGEQSTDNSGSADKTSENKVVTSGNENTDFTSDSTDDRSLSSNVSGSIKTDEIGDWRDNSETGVAFSDTPQGNIGNVQDLDYLTNYTNTLVDDKKTSDVDTTVTNKSDTTGTDNLISTREDKTTNTHDGTETANYTDSLSNTFKGKVTSTNNKINNLKTTDEYVEEITGKLGGKTYPELIREYRDTILNIDMMIINELRDLFMLIF